MYATLRATRPVWPSCVVGCDPGTDGRGWLFITPGITVMWAPRAAAVAVLSGVGCTPGRGCGRVARGGLHPGPVSDARGGGWGRAGGGLPVTWFGGLDHGSRAPTTAQDAHFHRWMPMAMVATSYLSHLTSRVASGWLNADGAHRPLLATGSVGIV